MTDREIFQANLTELIRRSKVRQIDVAKYAEVSFQTVSSWVTGRGYPRADAMERLLLSPALRDELIARGRHQRTLFSWQRTATLLWQSIQQTVAER